MDSIINIMAEHEEAISRLYRKFSEEIPQYRDFWDGLALEEMQHASWVRTLGANISKDMIDVDDNRFDKETIQKSIDYLDSQILEVDSKGIGIGDALSISLTYEEALIECGMFNVFEGDADAVKELLSALRDSTKEHVDRIRALFKEIID